MKLKICSFRGEIFLKQLFQITMCLLALSFAIQYLVPIASLYSPNYMEVELPGMMLFIYSLIVFSSFSAFAQEGIKEDLDSFVSHDSTSGVVKDTLKEKVSSVLSDSSNEILILDSVPQKAQNPATNQNIEDIDGTSIDTLAKDPEGVLTSDYNLGRTIGSRALVNTASLYIMDPGLLFANIMHSQSGVDDVYNFGWTGMNEIGGDGDNGLLLFAFPEFDINFRIGTQNRLHFSFSTLNLLFATSNGYTITGFEIPFYSLQTYRWDFLSKDGSITINGDQYENAFYFRPLVNRGQLRLQTDAIHTLRNESSSQTPIVGIKTQACIGLLDNLQLNCGVLYKKTEDIFDNYYNNYYHDDYYSYSSPIHLMVDTMNIAAGAVFRTEKIGLWGGYDLQNVKLSKNLNAVQRFDIGGSYILGKSVYSSDVVNGNWDNSNSALLGINQLIAQANAEYLYRNAAIDSKGFIINSKIDYGLTQITTIGSYFSAKIDNNSRTTYDLKLNGEISNISRRQVGPSEVSNLEYLYGYMPKKGEVRAALSYRIPAIKKRSLYLGPNSIQEYLSQQQGIYAFENMLNGKQLVQWGDQVQSHGLLDNNDLSLRVVSGMGERVRINCSLEIRTDLFDTLHTAVYNEYDPYGYNSSSYYSPINSNVLYATNCGFTFGNSLLFTIMLSMYGQTDKHTSDKDKFDFMINALIQTAF